MPRQQPPTVVGRGLGGELRQLRKDRGLTAVLVATQLDWEPSRLSRMETGQQGIRTEEVAALLVVYGVTGDERKRLLGMVNRARDNGWWETHGGLPAESRTLIRLEAEATEIVDWEPLLIPGLLQTADYTRALMRGGGIPENDAQSRVAARLGRQAILTRGRLGAVIAVPVTISAPGPPRRRCQGARDRSWARRTLRL